LDLAGRCLHLGDVDLDLITHTALGYLVFGQLPDIWTVSGAMIVIASGVYLVHREHVTAVERRKAERDALNS
jgi:hypothetical protein